MVSGVYWNQPVCQSVCLSVYLFVYPSVQNSSGCQSPLGDIKSHLVTALVVVTKDADFRLI